LGAEAGLAGLDVLHVDALAGRPLQEVKIRELRAVVAHDRVGLRMLLDGELERSGHGRRRLS